MVTKRRDSQITVWFIQKVSTPLVVLQPSFFWKFLLNLCIQLADFRFFKDKWRFSRIMLAREYQLPPDIWRILGRVKPGLWTHFLAWIENEWSHISESRRTSLWPHKDTPHQRGEQPAEHDLEQLLPEAAIIPAVNSTKITEITSSKVLQLWLIVQYKFPKAHQLLHSTFTPHFRDISLGR